MSLIRSPIQVCKEYTNSPDPTFTAAGLSIDFGFQASVIDIRNFSTKPVYFTLASSMATTSNHCLSTGQTIQLVDLGGSLLGIAASSSGSGLYIGAWGG